MRDYAGPSYNHTIKGESVSKDEAAKKEENREQPLRHKPKTNKVVRHRHSLSSPSAETSSSDSGSEPEMYSKSPTPPGRRNTRNFVSISVSPH